MTLQDFSDNFDTLLNSYAVTAGFGSTDNPTSVELTEYEKSVFLTKAQEEEILSLYNGKNPYGESFEQTEEMRRYLAPLVETVELEPITNSSNQPLGINSSSKFFSLPDGSDENNPAVWFLIYESVTVTNSECASMASQEVYPVRHDEYSKIKKNPFRGANDRRALRLDLSDNVVEIISNHPVTKYLIRYLRKPSPIILSNLSDDNTIDGKTEASESFDIPEQLHQKVLERAVMLALRTKGIKINNENR